MAAAALTARQRLERVLELSAHPVRLHVLLTLAERRASPKDLVDLRPDLDLGVVAYHVRCLAAAGAIREVARIPRRGAVQHVYQLTAKGGRHVEIIEELLEAAGASR
jgi:Asp/Glu/hydantoin racemase